MSKKAVKEQKQLEELSKELVNSYANWNRIFKQGCNDPQYSDGTNIDLVRNHIMYYRGQLEELLIDRYHLYPDFYWLPVPPKLPYNFMAVDRVVRGELVLSNKEVK